MITEKAREKARNLRYKRAMLAELNIEYIKEKLSEISEACDDVRYYIESDGPLLNALDGDEEEEFEFRMMFSELSAECDNLWGLLDEVYVDKHFNDFFVGIMLNNRSPFRMIGWDSYEEDYFPLIGYEENIAENESYKRIMRLSKKELICICSQCFGTAASFFNVQQKYEYCKAAFDILRDQNTSFLQVIRDIDKAYEAADADKWDPYSANVKTFEKLVRALPDKAWVE